MHYTIYDYVNKTRRQYVKIVQIYASSRYMCEIISTKGAEIRYYSTLSSARKRSKLTFVHAIARNYVLAYVRSATETRVRNSINGQN